MIKRFLIAPLLGVISAFAATIHTIDEKNFKSETGSKTVLVDFYADWCGPCKRLSRALKVVADDMGDKVKIVKVNIDTSPALADQYEVKSVPTMLLFEDGKVKGKLVGFRDKSAIKKFIQNPAK